MKKRILFTAAMLCSVAAFSQVDIEKSCYTSSLPQKNGEYIFLQSRIYYDSALKKEIGAAVKYRNSNDWIPLVYVERTEIEEDFPELGNNRTRRAEVISGKITGTYYYVQTGAGIKAGKYMEYKNIKTKSRTVFQYSSNYDKCSF